MPLKFYTDKACTSPIINLIRWDNEIIIELVTGEKKVFDNMVEAGKTATATVYIRNEDKFPYAITSISYPDKRVSVHIKVGWLEPWTPAKVIFKFQAPKNATSKDIVEAEKVDIKVYRIFDR